MPQNTQRFKRVAVVFVFSSQVDSSLSFLDGFVSEALAAGAAPYKPPHQRKSNVRTEVQPLFTLITMLAVIYTTGTL